MLNLNSVVFICIGLLAKISLFYCQNNLCTPAAVQNCGTYPCVQTGATVSCLCPNMSLQASAAQCNSGTTIPPNQCGNAVCPAGATCIPTNQNPSLYICLCPNNIIANPSCPTSPLPNNPCLANNPCRNGGTCAVDPLTLQAVCICPPNTYGRYCVDPCVPRCDPNWCYNGGRCVNAYGQPYCVCGQNYRGRRCELRYDRYNYVYLYHYPRW